MLMKILPLHEVLTMLAWFEGTWITLEPGVALEPPATRYSYYDQINITSIGLPLFNYIEQTWDAETGLVGYQEAGFLHVNPKTNKISLDLMSTEGMVTIQQGDLTDDRTIDLRGGTVYTKDGKPIVSQTRRIFKLDPSGDKMEQVYYLSTPDMPEMVEHGRAKYTRVA